MPKAGWKIIGLFILGLFLLNIDIQAEEEKEEEEKPLQYNSETSKIVHQETIFLNTEELEDFRVNSVSSVYASLNSRLALKTSIQVIYQNLPIEGHKNTDMYFLSSLVINI